MEVIADLHIHSRFSIATARDADLEHLDLWGRYKGLQVVGTGDCTHPRWLAEMAAKLEPAAAGVYTLKPDLALPLNLEGPGWEAAAPVKFVITGEVSTIYKKGGKVRKVHLLLVLPDLAAAQQLSRRLGRLGNVASDGRPILGLDARFVLDLVMEIDPQALVIPAHIWTPWFSVLGSKSGFDSLEECFEASTAHIHAVETGLSSDPAMNWRVSGLDRFVLVSNSDAHSPQKLGREANIFHVAPTYPDLARALRTREGFGGTLEFFPQEGKYHLDGHRNCGLRLEPDEAERLSGLCPRLRQTPDPGGDASRPGPGRPRQRGAPGCGQPFRVLDQPAGNPGRSPGGRTRPAKKCAWPTSGSWPGWGRNWRSCAACPWPPWPGREASSWPTALTGCAGGKCTSMGATTALMERFASLPRPSATNCWARGPFAVKPRRPLEARGEGAIPLWSGDWGDLPLVFQLTFMICRSAAQVKNHRRV